MKKVYKAHPLMLFSLMKPFLLILAVPLLKGAIQYIVKRRITGVLAWEALAFVCITVIVVFRYNSFRLTCNGDIITIRIGVIFRKKTVINVSKLSSVQSVQSPLDAVFGAVTYRINTEAGRKGKSDFEFKMSKNDSIQVSSLLYKQQNNTAVKFSILKVAVMAATTSSAVTGMIIGVPVINKAGKLLGLALSEILLDEINSVSSRFETYFPPIVNTVTLVFLLGYAVSFIYSLFKYINFKLYLGEDKLEVRSGFFIRTRTSFKKESINIVRIDQTPLMNLFRRYSMKVGVGGYGDSKSESAVIVPSGRKGEIKRQFAIYFPFLAPDGKLIHAKRDVFTKSRFLFWPAVCFLCLIAVSITLSLIFVNFSRLILFLTVVAGGIILYYGRICFFEFRFGKIRIGKNIFAQGIKGFRTCELYCQKENVGQIRIIRTIPDIIQKTCNVVINVRSESADSIKIRHIDYETAKQYIYECYGISE